MYVSKKCLHVQILFLTLYNIISDVNLTIKFNNIIEINHKTLQIDTWMHLIMQNILVLL